MQHSILILCINMYSQTNIDYENLDIFTFNIPNSYSRLHAVKKEVIYLQQSDSPKSIIKEKIYDRNGVLIELRRIDNINFLGEEKITYKQVDNGKYIITREINKRKIISAGPVPDSFWADYFPLLTYLKNDNSQKIIVKSIYKFSEDSTLRFETYINNQIIDSGLFIGTNYGLVGDPNYFCCKVDSISNGDTLKVIKTEKINDSVCWKYISNYKQGVLFEYITQYLKKGKIEYQNFTSYKYNIKGKRISEDYFERNRLVRRKIYEYDARNPEKYKVYEEKYSSGVLDRPETISIFNEEGRIIQEETNLYRDGFVNRKIYYKYSDKGLLTEMRIEDNNIVKATYTYNYKFY